MVMESTKRKLLLYLFVAFIAPSERRELKERPEEDKVRR